MIREPQIGQKVFSMEYSERAYVADCIGEYEIFKRGRGDGEYILKQMCGINSSFYHYGGVYLLRQADGSFKVERSGKILPTFETFSDALRCAATERINRAAEDIGAFVDYQCKLGELINKKDKEIADCKQKLTELGEGWYCDCNQEFHDYSGSNRSKENRAFIEKIIEMRPRAKKQIEGD
jgi:hypothetical protein